MRGDTCRNKLADILDKELFNDCLEFMVRIKQARHVKIITRQLSKFDRLQHCIMDSFTHTPRGLTASAFTTEINTTAIPSKQQ